MLVILVGGMPVTATVFAVTGFALTPSCIDGGVCNILGVCHQLNNGIELKHDMLSGDEGERSNLQE